MVSETITLKGMTWDHARGYDPMLATSAAYHAKNPAVVIEWDKRSLQAFADRPIEQMVNEYDLIVIDHPHVGEIARSELLLALDQEGRDDDMKKLAGQSVGFSHTSYRFNGHQWGLAIDAATPVAAYRADQIESPPYTWAQVVALAKHGQVGFALIPINALMTFLGMANNLGMAVAQREDLFIEKPQGTQVLETLLEIVGLMDPRCLQLDPIGILDWMSTENHIVYSPFGYGYTNYSRDGYCPFPITFTNAPGFASHDPRGTILGGTGIAVSRLSQHRDIAVDYAFWIASAECQSGLFFDSGGQPANALAWDSERCNAACRNFFLGTHHTLDTACLRPCYDGYMGFQHEAGEIIHQCLKHKESVSHTLEALEQSYRRSHR